MLRISLRQLLLLMAVVALAMVSLKYASIFWQGLIGLVAMLAFFAALIIGIFERGHRQAFAIGYAVVAIGYLAMLLVDDFRYGLPTTQLLTSVYYVAAEPGWMRMDTEERVTEAEARRLNASASSGSVTATPTRYPLDRYFYATGHYWWTLILGYSGGCLARFVYLRRRHEQTSHTRE